MNERRRSRIDAVGWIATAFLVGLAAIAIVAPLITADPNRIDLNERLAAPDAEHWMGTDELGRDVLARVVHGSRVSLLVGVASALISFLVGVAIGALAGFYGGAIDWIVMRVVEVTLCFPFYFLVLAIVAINGPSLVSIILALALTNWTQEARFVRGEMLRLKESEFAWAARASGAGPLRIAFRHLLPHAVTPAIVSASFGVAIAILGESALSFLGFGIELPLASWGSVLSSADDHIGRAWWLAVFPGAAIFLTVSAVNIVADRLNALLDPRGR